MKFLKYFLVIFVLFIVSIIVFVSVNFYKMQNAERYYDNNLSIYTENQMSKYDGGDKAEKFFPKYSQIRNFKKISFQYCDNTPRSNFFHEYYPYFCLDIILDNNDYQSYVEKFKDTGECFAESSHFMVLKEECENDNLRAILCNDETKTVRYVLFYGDFQGYNNGISPIIGWNMELNQKDGSLKTGD